MLTTTWLQFKTATDTDTKVKARGTNMAVVDESFNAYLAGVATANPVQEIGLLQALVTACKDWLKLKKDKSEKKLFGRTNELLVKRKVAVASLGNEALTELFSRLQHHGLLTTDLRGQIHFDKNKLATLGATNRMGGTGAHHIKPLKPMGHDYAHERTSYLQSGKTQAISGSGVHATHRGINGLIKSNDLDQLSVGTRDPAEKQKLIQQAAKIARKDVHNLSLKEFEILDSIGKLNVTSGDVDYLKKADRYRFMAIPDNTGKLRDYNDQLITTHAYKVTAYAMDRYGNLIQKNADPFGNSLFFNHSSFNAGQDVICAGTLVIAAGMLQTIDNNSGHYKPLRENLHNCLDILLHEGVDLSQTVVNLYVWVNGVKQEHQYHAAAFLANPNGQPFQIN